jgi:hypothetical protein
MVVDNTKNLKILLIDNETFGILAECQSIPISNTLTNGLINTTTMVVVIDDHLDSFNDYKLVQQKILGKTGESNAAKFSLTIDKKVRHSVELFNNPSERFKERKELARIRNYGLNHLENGCKRFSARILSFYGDECFYSFINDELKKSNLKEEKFSDGIIEWAGIYQVDPRVAYNELKMQYDSISINMIKINAIWKKLSEKINKLTDVKEIHVCSIYDFESEMFFGTKLKNESK